MSMRAAPPRRLPGVAAAAVKQARRASTLSRKTKRVLDIVGRSLSKRSVQSRDLHGLRLLDESVDAEISRAGKEDRRELGDEQRDQLDMTLGEKSRVVHEEKRCQQIDQDPRRGRSSGQTKHHQDRTDTVGEQGEG